MAKCLICHVLACANVLLHLLAALRIGSCNITQKGLPHSAIVPCRRRQANRDRSKLRTPAPRRKIDVKSEQPVGCVSVFTLIRTDTTLDHSQKAEKVWSCLVEGLWLFQSWLARVCLYPSCRSACSPNERGKVLLQSCCQRGHCSYTLPFMHLPLLKAC